MSLLGITLLAQLAVTSPVTSPVTSVPPHRTPPVLAFPERGLDDSAAYQGYQTRLFRDAAGNTVQIYLDQREGRVVHLLADAEDESVGFTARDARGAPVALDWNAPSARVASVRRTRVLEHDLVADAPAVHLGWFLLGSMRVERDFQYAQRHRAPYGGAPFALAEIDRLLAALTTLGEIAPAAQRVHLALLGAADVATLRARLRPRITTTAGATRWVTRVVQPSLDARDTLTLEIAADPRVVDATAAGDTVVLRARAGSRVPFTVRVTTTGATLTPLARREMFTPEFLAFLARAQAAAARAGALDSVVRRARWLEREVRGVELLSSREKLMAGLPTYATYFGRDQLVSALMMRPIWRGAMSEAVIGSVLRKLAPRGDVSHEEALGGQAIRESAAEYAAAIDTAAGAARRGDRAAADTLVARAAAVLRDLRRVRENYHMIDDEFQLPVLVARWIDDPAVPAAHKRAFLLDSSDAPGKGTRLARLLRELALVSRMTEAYAREPVAANLVSFAPRDANARDVTSSDTTWGSASWRDSGAGYADGRFAMDVNAIWAPRALEATGRILAALRTLRLTRLTTPEAAWAASPLAAWARDTAALRAAVATWRGAERHFVVRLSPSEVRADVSARLAAMPAAEREFWTPRLDAALGGDSLTFLALSLDARGRPIAVMNTDPATRLFLSGSEGPRSDRASDAEALRDARPFVRDYPVGLFVPGVGPAVANDAYAPPAVWRAFERDPYHGPKVVWGREVNLFLLGAASHAAAATDPAAARELRDAVRQVRDAVAASGFHSELWSYGVEGGRVVPLRYGTGADVQLWSTTDLAVQYLLSRLGAR